MSSTSRVNLLGWWAPWLGVVVFGIAAAIYFSAPRGALPWLMLVLLAAWLGQLVGDRLVGADVSGFFGALVMTPIALAIARLPGGPPSQVTFLPAFWLLVPGAIGLIGVTEVVGDPADGRHRGPRRRRSASIVAIALGVLVGASLFRGLSAVHLGAGAPAVRVHLGESAGGSVHPIRPAALRLRHHAPTEVPPTNPHDVEIVA